MGEGASVKDVQAQLGHAEASVTLDIYTAVIAEHASDLAARLDQVRARTLKTTSERLSVEHPPEPL
jgi:site-specific recombinase XerD